MRTKEEILTEIQRLELMKRNATDAERDAIKTAITALYYSIGQLTAAWFAR